LKTSKSARQFFGSRNSKNRVPIDRPLFVNTSMSAQNRIDLYRRLDDPPRDSEPALLFRLP
uniref:Alpha/beta hydrolase n=1 Tax=Heligmosomoides polygyrus TaxID=6339 RepID=A0A183GVG1_HELPZ